MAVIEESSTVTFIHITNQGRNLMCVMRSNKGKNAVADC